MSLTDDLRKNFFNERAKGWMENHYKDPNTGAYDLHSERIRDIVASLDLAPDSRVLDVGCGSGVLVPYLLDCLSADGRILEADYSDEMIRENQKRHPDRRISFICSDIAGLALDAGSLDAVICFACFPHFESPQKALARMAAVLIPGGRLTIAHLMSAEELAAHHNSHTPVSEDRLPPEETMKGYVRDAGFDITGFENRLGLYQLCAVRTG